MTRRSLVLALAWGVAACAPAAPEPVSPAAPAATESASASAAPAEPPPEPEPSASAAPAPSERPPPPLSSPNPRLSVSDAGAPDSGSDEDAGKEDPRTRALRAVATAAQDCHAQHTPTGRGRVLLGLRLNADGSVANVEVRHADPAFASKAFQSCVTNAVRRQRFPTPSPGATELEIPLDLDPVP